MTRKCLALILIFTTSIATAGNWPNWRGPNGNGVAEPGTYPTKWTNSENVVWKLSLPGRGASTPTVWDEKIILTYGHDDKNVVLCLDKSGKELWKTSVGADSKGKHAKASGSNPSAVTDGKHVFVYFKSGDLACLTLDGKQVWTTNLQAKFGNDTLWWDLGTSPVLSKENVIVACMQTGPSYLAAVNNQSGELAWKVDRQLDAPLEAAQSYSTPIVMEDGDKETIYVLGADHVTAHAGADGKELWRVGGLNPGQEKFYRSISGPVIADGLLVAPYARGGSVTGIELGGQGDVTKSHVKWTRLSMGADVPSPVATDGKVYVCRDRGSVATLDLKTGDVIGETQLEKSRSAFSASPVLAGGNLYVTREDGTTFVLDAKTLALVSTNALGDGEQTVATPVFVNGRILLRTYNTLYCIGS